ncbi:MAG: hypothetical protein ACI4OV_02420 [Victivallaceae bacterium]
MAIDAMIDRFRATGCAYAIDGKQGGRLLSPLQQVDYRDFAANPQNWGTSWASGIGANDGWELDITCRFNTPDTSLLIFGAGYGNLVIQPSTTVVLVSFYCVDTSTSPAWSVEPDFAGQATTNIGTISVSVSIKQSIFTPGEFHNVKLVRGDGFVSVYLDNSLVATCTGTLINNKAFSSITNWGNIQSITLKNSAGITVWQAPQSELYSGWLLKPLSQVPGGATFEIKQGLLQYGDNTVSSDSAGNLVSPNSTVNYRFIYVPIDLRGYTGNFSLMWQGDCTSGSAIFNQGSGGTSKVTVQLGAATTTDTGYFAMGNGTKNFSIGVNKEIATPGKITYLVSVNRETGEVYVYANGVIAGSGTVPDDFGALNPDANAENITVRLVDGLSHFAFWNRALSPEEVAAL